MTPEHASHRGAGLRASRVYRSALQARGLLPAGGIRQRPVSGRYHGWPRGTTGSMAARRLRENGMSGDGTG